MNVTELRNDLIDNYKSLQKKGISLEEAKGISRLAGNIIASAIVQLKYNKLLGRKKTIKFLDGQ